MNPVLIPSPPPPPSGVPGPDSGVRELPDGRVVLPRFFIFDEHLLEELLHDEAGEPLKDANGQHKKRSTPIDRDVLEQIARNNNARIAETGDVCPIVVGHTKDDAPEHRQPEIIGYATDFRVEPFYATGRYAISVTPIAKNREAVEQFRKYPRRSVEFWRGSLQIDPISLLGATTPERDLGIHRFSKSAAPGSERPVKYAITDHYPNLTNLDPQPEATPVADPKTTSTTDLGGDDSHDSLVEKVIAALSKTKEFEWIRAQMQAVPDQPEEGGDPDGVMPGDDGDDGQFPPGQGQGDDDFSDDDLEALLAGHGGGDDPYGDHGDDDPDKNARGRGYMGHYTDNDQYGGMGDDPVDYAAGVGGMNAGYVPSYGGGGGRQVQYQRQKAAEERMRYKKFEERVAALESQVQVVTAENQQLKAERDAAEVDADLNGLFAEGVDFEYQPEYDRLIRFSREARRQELDRMRKHYQRRAPNGGKVAVPPGSLAQTPARYQRAQDKAIGSPVAVDHQEARKIAGAAAAAGFGSVQEYLASKQVGPPMGDAPGK